MIRQTSDVFSAKIPQTVTLDQKKQETALEWPVVPFLFDPEGTYKYVVLDRPLCAGWKEEFNI
jgi:hypothetical protein